MNWITLLFYSKQTGIRILRHVLFWAVDICSYLIVVSSSREIDAIVVYGILFKIPLVALATYFILYYLIPKFSTYPDKGKLLLWIIGILIFLGVVIRYYKFYFLNPIIEPNYTVPEDTWEFGRIVSEILSSLIVICMAVTIKLIKNKSELQQSNEKLLEEKRIAELNFLRAQMQPHFLFNTLNTLYSEAIQESGKAQQVVLHLSSLLRFILDECSKPLIPVSNEIKVIKDFIALERLRHGSRLQVDLVVSNINPEILISPLIFLPFVENSFKHTLSSKRGPIKIDITLTMKDENFNLIVENDKGESAPERNNGHPHGKGVGNVTRQLELLYGKNYSLQQNDNQDKYRVSLVVPTIHNGKYA